MSADRVAASGSSPTGAGYIDTGDRVVVTESIAEPAHARGTNPAAVGQHGVVTANDGWGRCDVLLDSGARITAWNGIDLVREDEAAPRG